MNLQEKLLQFPAIKNHPVILEFVKFSIVGVLGAIVDFSTYALLTRVGHLYYIYATAISVFLAIVNNFYFNKYWTFNKGDSGETKIEYLKFFIVSAVNYFINLGIVYFIVEYTKSDLLFGKYEDIFAKAMAIGIVLICNYFGNKYWTFKN